MTRRIDARRGEFAVAAFLFIVGFFFVWQASLLPMGTVGLPGPGFLPLVLGLLLAVASIGVAVRRARVERLGDKIEIGHPPLVLTYMALLAVPLFFERLGAVVTLTLFAALAARIIGRVPWWKATAGAVLFMAAAWYFFKTLLGVQLPAGIL